MLAHRRKLCGLRIAVVDGLAITIHVRTIVVVVTAIVPRRPVLNHSGIRFEAGPFGRYVQRTSVGWF